MHYVPLSLRNRRAAFKITIVKINKIVFKNCASSNKVLPY